MQEPNSAHHSQPPRPDRVSAEGMAKVCGDVRLLDLLTEQLAHLDELVQHGSFGKGPGPQPGGSYPPMLVSMYGTKESNRVEREHKIDLRAYWDAKKHLGTVGPISSRTLH